MTDASLAAQPPSDLAGLPQDNPSLHMTEAARARLPRLWRRIVAGEARLF